ncbi:MAG: 23S rRNA (adenine(2503)-C(2))-methyltransferase RlmN [Acidimicrobiales bacterium]|nr:23S rRNA (adenine(2503)-C(2))-methyltransferase RlmN [Acidimicrobiales bacterium]
MDTTASDPADPGTRQYDLGALSGAARAPLPARPALLDLDRGALAAFLGDEPRFRTDQVWNAINTKGQSPDQISSIPLRLRSRLAEEFPPALTPVTEQRSGDGRTTKWLFELNGGAQVETVLMRYRDRATVCVSSQAGCAMACSFCATGQAGFERHLTVAEILEQVHRAKDAASPQRLSNIVFMGMGEPLANLERLFTAIERITTDIGIGSRKITVSTVGLVPAMERFADANGQVGLAVSLHAANDDLRSELVPLNRRYPINELIQACQMVRDKTGRRVSFEWAMIGGVNDRDRDANELIGLARKADAHVNLIPLNSTPGYPTTGSSPQQVKHFAGVLRRAGVNVTIRSTMGDDIDAACGQLANRGATT